MNAQLPVSAKFYSDITSRVSTALSYSPESAAEAVRIIDLYMTGAAVATDDSAAMLAFNMIRDEIDRAMARSSRARQRAAANRRHCDGSGKKIAGNSDVTPTDSTTTDVTTDVKPSRPLSRRRRREAERMLRGRSGRKWLPIGGGKGKNQSI